MRGRPIPRRIGVVTAFPPGRNSLNEFGFHLVTHLAANEQLDTVVVLADETDEGPPMEIPGTSAVACWRFNDLRNPYRILAAVRREKLDAVLINLQFATFGDTRIAGGLGLLTPALLSRAGIPTGVILHNLVENVDMEDAGFASSKAVAKLMSSAGRALTRTILVADYVALTIPRYVELLQVQYGAANALLTPHGSFEEIAEPQFGIPTEGPRRILAFGKWGTYKTVDVLVEAYRILGERGYDDLELVIAGTDSPNSAGYLAGVQADCADLDSVVFTGYVEEEDVAGLFGSAAVTAFPYTSTTGSSGVLHQAGAYGRAAVLPAIGDFVEVIEEEGFIGMYFEPGDANSLADALAKMLDDNELTVDHGKRNFLASTGIPMAEVIDWHLLHLEEAMANRADGTARIATTPPHAGSILPLPLGPAPQRTASGPSTPDLDAYRTWAETPNSEKPTYSVVIPAYNEQDRILPTLGAIATHMSGLGEPWELLIADDGSTDRTVEILQQLSLVNMQVLEARRNGGKGSAVRRGMLAAQGDIILFADADQSTPIEQFETLRGAIENGADVAIGSRAAAGASVANKSMARNVFSKGLNVLARAGFGVAVADTQCGFKMFTAAAAKKLFQRQLIDGFSFDLEILYLAEKFGMEIAEVPVDWIDAPGTTVDPTKVAVDFLRDMSVIRMNDLRGRYDKERHHS